MTKSLPGGALGSRPPSGDRVLLGCNEIFEEQVLPRLLSEQVNPGQAAVQFRDYPLPVSDFSWKAAMAGRSVQDRAGDEAFWTFSRLLYDNQDSLGWELIEQAATQVDVDGAAVVEDARNDKYRPVVTADKEYGSSIGVSGPPTVFVNGNIVTAQGAPSYDGYYQAIADAIDQV